jgi:hypothetical protein
MLRLYITERVTQGENIEKLICSASYRLDTMLTKKANKRAEVLFDGVYSHSEYTGIHSTQTCASLLLWEPNILGMLH